MLAGPPNIKRNRQAPGNPLPVLIHPVARMERALYSRIWKAQQGLLGLPDIEPYFAGYVHGCGGRGARGA